MQLVDVWQWPSFHHLPISAFEESIKCSCQKSRGFSCKKMGKIQLISIVTKWLCVQKVAGAALPHYMLYSNARPRCCRPEGRPKLPLAGMCMCAKIIIGDFIRHSEPSSAHFTHWLWWEYFKAFSGVIYTLPNINIRSQVTYIPWKGPNKSCTPRLPSWYVALFYSQKSFMLKIWPWNFTHYTMLLLSKSTRVKQLLQRAPLAAAVSLIEKPFKRSNS